jgi:hypothetical protein
MKSSIVESGRNVFTALGTMDQQARDTASVERATLRRRLQECAGAFKLLPRVFTVYGVDDGE